MRHIYCSCLRKALLDGIWPPVNVTKPNMLNIKRTYPIVHNRTNMAHASLLQSIPFVHGMYRSDVYTMTYLQDRKYKRTFSVETLLQKLVWKHERNETIFSIRDGVLAHLVDIKNANIELVRELCIYVTIWKWPLLAQRIPESIREETQTHVLRAYADLMHDSTTNTCNETLWTYRALALMRGAVLHSDHVKK